MYWIFDSFGPLDQFWLGQRWRGTSKQCTRGGFEVLRQRW